MKLIRMIASPSWPSRFKREKTNYRDVELLCVPLSLILSGALILIV